MNIPAKYKKRSARYRALEAELRVLRAHLLPNPFSPTGLYPDPVYTRTIAYRVLAHAEFESYLEDRVQDLFLTAVASWQNYNKVSKVITCMLAFSGMQMDGPPNSRT